MSTEDVRASAAYSLMERGWGLNAAVKSAWALHPFDHGMRKPVRKYEKAVRRLSQEFATAMREQPEDKTLQLAKEALSVYAAEALEYDERFFFEMFRDLANKELDDDSDPGESPTVRPESAPREPEPPGSDAPPLAQPSDAPTAVTAAPAAVVTLAEAIVTYETLKTLEDESNAMMARLRSSANALAARNRDLEEVPEPARGAAQEQLQASFTALRELAQSVLEVVRIAQRPPAAHADEF